MVAVSLKGPAQIQLPTGYQCVLGEGHYNESYFTNGKLSFLSYPWGHDGIKGQKVIKLIEEGYGNKIKFAKTKDGLHWATGKANGFYIYIVLVEGQLQYTLRSLVKDTEFSNNSTWLLQQIRNNITSGNDNYYTDSYGNSCSGTNLDNR